MGVGGSIVVREINIADERVETSQFAMSDVC